MMKPPFLRFVIPLLLAGSAVSAGDRVEDFLSEARQAFANRDGARLEELVADARIVNFEAVATLLSEDDGNDGELAARLAAIHRDVFDDDAPLRRVRMFRGWSTEERAVYDQAVERKEAGNAAFREGRNDEARALYEEALARFDQVGDTRGEANCHLNLGSVASVIGDPVRGLEHLDRASALAAEAGDREAVAWIEHNRAYGLIDLGKLEEAKQALEVALSVSREAGERGVEASALNTLGTLELSLGQLDEAELHFRATGAIAEELGDPQLEGITWVNLAAIDGLRGDLSASAASLERAFGIAREAGDPPAMADTALALSQVELERGDADVSREWLDRATEIAAAIESPLLQARIAFAEARLVAEHSRYADSLAWTDRALEHLEELDAPLLLGRVLQARAVALFYLAEYDAAFAAAERAGSLAGAAGDPKYEADVRILVAYLAATLGDLETGLEKATAAVELYRVAGDVIEQGRALNTLGFLRVRSGAAAAARAAFAEAETLLTPESSPRELSELLLDMAALELETGGRLEDALERVQRARTIAGEDHTYELIHAGLLEAEILLRTDKAAAARDALDGIRSLPRASRTAVHEWRFQYLSGRVRLALGDPAEALEAFQRAVDEVERLRSGARRVPWKATLLEDRIAPYRELAALQVSLGRAEEAYRTARMAKARTFVERLSGIDDLERTFGETGSRGRDERLLPAAIAPVGALQEALAAGEIVLDFFFVPDALLVFAIDEDDLSVTRVSTTEEELRPWVESLRHPGRASSQEAAVTDAFHAASTRLANILLTPLAEALVTREHLLIVPNGPLHAIPFAALEFRGRPLFESHAISVLPAVEVLLANRREGTVHQPPRTLILGDPITADRGYPPLPGARAEARSVARVVKGEDATVVRLGEDASESYLRDHAREYEVIHVAAHGRVDRRFPANSYLALTAGDGEDGRWSAAEIAAQTIPAELIVLSGCGTGVEGSLVAGFEPPGDEREGLVRAFLGAGAASVVASLWEIDDDAARAILPRFYEKLVGGDTATPSRALSALQRDLVAGKIRTAAGRALTHPFYWAGLVSYGGGWVEPSSPRDSAP